MISLFFVEFDGPLDTGEKLLLPPHPKKKGEGKEGQRSVGTAPPCIFSLLPGDGREIRGYYIYTSARGAPPKLDIGSIDSYYPPNNINWLYMYWLSL